MEYKFDRYIDGKLMAEGVVIERAKSFADATFIASKIASRGQNGQLPVLVFANGKDRIEALEAALRSIAANTCCDKCQEAALVARAALGEKKDD
jgi:hypothetical protein